MCDEKVLLLSQIVVKQRIKNYYAEQCRLHFY